MVRRIWDLHRPANPEQASLFELWRLHAFFTTSDLDTVTADKTHRAHAIIEQVHADLKNSRAGAPAVRDVQRQQRWLVCAVIAFNLTRAAATLAGGRLTKATTGTIRRTLIAVPARAASSARRLRLHLPQDWPWEQQWTALFTRSCGPPRPATS